MLKKESKMNESGLSLIALAIVVFAVVHGFTNRYEVVIGQTSNVIFSKDNWTGDVELCTSSRCFVVQSE